MNRFRVRLLAEVLLPVAEATPPVLLREFRKGGSSAKAPAGWRVYCAPQLVLDDVLAFVRQRSRL